MVRIRFPPAVSLRTFRFLRRNTARRPGEIRGAGAAQFSNLEDHSSLQLEFPLGLADEERRPGAKKGLARLVVDRVVDRVCDRFGWEAIGYASVALGASRPVPDAFRELARKGAVTPRRQKDA